MRNKEVINSSDLRFSVQSQIIAEETSNMIATFLAGANINNMRAFLMEAAMRDQHANPESYDPETGRTDDILDLNSFLGMLDKASARISLRMEREGFQMDF